MTSIEQGERDLRVLLENLQPKMLPVDYVFCTLPSVDALDLTRLAPLAMFNEAEGLSAILPEEAANAAGFSSSAPLRCITLGVHSSLAAVGLTAAVTTALADVGISANVVAAFHHDHVLVPSDRAEEALVLLAGLSRR